MLREWQFYLTDMIEFAELVLEYTAGYKQSQFIEDRRTFDATLRNLELMGEAATHIPDEVRESYDDIPWRQLIATRNRIVHAYLGLDNDILWSIVEQDVPELLVNLKLLRDKQ